MQWSVPAVSFIGSGSLSEPYSEWKGRLATLFTYTWQRLSTAR